MNDMNVYYQKTNLKPYLYGMFSLASFIFLMVFAMAFFRGQVIPKWLDPLNVFKNKGLFPLFSQILIQSCFAVFSAVLFSKIFISDYQNQQQVLSFSNSSSPSRIVWKKLALSSAWVMAATFFSTIICLGALLLSSTYVSLFNESELLLSWSTILIGAALSGSVALAIGMISLAIGFRRKSAILTIIASLIMSSALSNIMQMEN